MLHPFLIFKVATILTFAKDVVGVSDDLNPLVIQANETTAAMYFSIDKMSQCYCHALHNYPRALRSNFPCIQLNFHATSWSKMVGVWEGFIFKIQLGPSMFLASPSYERNVSLVPLLALLSSLRCVSGTLKQPGIVSGKTHEKKYLLLSTLNLLPVSLFGTSLVLANPLSISAAILCIILEVWSIDALLCCVTQSDDAKMYTMWKLLGLQCKGLKGVSQRLGNYSWITYFQLKWPIKI